MIELWQKEVVLCLNHCGSVILHKGAHNYPHNLIVYNSISEWLRMDVLRHAAQPVQCHNRLTLCVGADIIYRLSTKI